MFTLCRNLADYQQAVDRALQENTTERQQQRIAFARSHSWQNNVREIYKYIQGKLK